MVSQRHQKLLPSFSYCPRFLLSQVIDIELTNKKRNMGILLYQVKLLINFIPIHSQNAFTP